MNLAILLLQAISSFIAIWAFLIVLNIQKSMLIPASVIGMVTWMIYYVLKEPTNVIVATFIAAVVGSSISQIVSIKLRTPTIVFAIAILAPLVPGYLSYRTTTLFVNGNYSQAVVSAILVIILALAISIGMASGTIVLKLYRRNKRKNLK
ncbi:threonine/serine exporter family protein [Streptococcus massiliensis]|uniref:Membrane protein n=1 Tax=Streptococcus massiliensis TaxID=313439 RepID=A0A380L1G4_9STRE|nr:threonine/serine exporter family protein [Streptococcus massiliensis]SUN77278.1 membrane protein [Streptococcus massiliensis]